jgi:hypothetical protein
MATEQELIEKRDSLNKQKKKIKAKGVLAKIRDPNSYDPAAYNTDELSKEIKKLTKSLHYMRHRTEILQTLSIKRSEKIIADDS